MADKKDKKSKNEYRSIEWFGRPNRDSMVHRSWMKNQGLPHHLFDGRPVIGICNTWSEVTPCNAHFRDIAEYVKKGVYEMGGFPLASLKQVKYWPPIGRVDNVYGDRNLFCSCVPIADYA